MERYSRDGCHSNTCDLSADESIRKSIIVGGFRCRREPQHAVADIGVTVHGLLDAQTKLRREHQPRSRPDTLPTGDWEAD